MTKGMITVRLDKTKLMQLERELPGRADKIIGAAAFEVQGDAQASFGSGPDGQTYKRGSITHVASKAGFPPNTDTGNLINSAFTNRKKPALWQVGFKANYADALEHGTPHIAPRPFLYPAIWRMYQKFNQKFRGLFK